MYVLARSPGECSDTTRHRYLDGPVAIIDAGTGGLTTALSLQHFGVPVRVFEQPRARREIGVRRHRHAERHERPWPSSGSAQPWVSWPEKHRATSSAAQPTATSWSGDPTPIHSCLSSAPVTAIFTVTKSDPRAAALDHRFDYLEQDGDKVIAASLTAAPSKLRP